MGWELASVFGVAVLGGVLPLWGRGSDRFLHGCLALATGIFLAAVFLHLLPELAAVNATPAPSELPVEAGAEPTAAEPTAAEPSTVAGSSEAAASPAATHGHSHGDTVLWTFVLIGVLGVYLAESLFFGRGEVDDVHHHRNVGYAALVGLSLHAFTAGLAFPAVGSEAVFVAIVAHKGFETFSLCSVFQLGKFPRAKLIGLLLLFSAVTPLGMLIGDQVLPLIGDRGREVATALAAGTFLYVCLCELLPEVFHRKEDTLLKLLLLFIGILVMGAISTFEA